MISPVPKVEFLYPTDSACSFIKHFILLEQGQKTESFFDKHIPDGHVAMVLNFKGNIHLYNNGEKISLPEYFLIPPLQKSILIESVPPFNTMVVVFHTTRFSKIFKLNLNQKESPPFKSAESFIPQQVFLALSNLKSAHERKTMFEEYIIEKTGRIEYSDDLIDDVFGQINMSKGTMQVQEIVALSGMDQRTFRRKFLSRAGMNAKTLCRITRFHHLWTSYLTKGTADMQNLIFEGGFYDQSHLINDFKELIGESPNTFFRRNQEKVKLISGKLTN